MLKTITLSAEGELIRKARDKANRERTTLNAKFRQWLKQYVSADFRLNDFLLTLKKKIVLYKLKFWYILIQKIK